MRNTVSKTNLKPYSLDAKTMKRCTPKAEKELESRRDLQHYFAVNYPPGHCCLNYLIQEWVSSILSRFIFNSCHPR